MNVAKIYRSGNFQTVRLPRQFHLKSAQVEIFRRGNEIVLRERQDDPRDAFDLLGSLPEDLAIAGRTKELSQSRRS